eukprot:6185808-Pleurochrysis_carterae.AAC.1
MARTVLRNYCCNCRAPAATADNAYAMRKVVSLVVCRVSGTMTKEKQFASSGNICETEAE